MNVKFSIRIYESRFWKNKYLQQDEPDKIKERNEDKIYIIRISRIEVKNVYFILYRHIIM